MSSGAVVARIRKALKHIESTLEKDPVIFIDSDGGHWINETASHFLKEKSVPLKDFVEWLKIGSNHLQGLTYGNIEIQMMKLPKNDIIVFLRLQKRRGLAEKPSLTAKEREILRYLVKGFTNRKIADLMNISPGTVNTHLDNLYAKLGCSNRVAACFTALKNGLFLPSP